MAELGYQNPTTKDSQLESKLVGTASDGTELRREVIDMSIVVNKLDEVLKAIQQLENTIISVFR